MWGNSLNWIFSGSRGHGSVRTSGNGETPAAVLLDIAMKCGAKVRNLMCGVTVSVVPTSALTRLEYFH